MTDVTYDDLRAWIFTEVTGRDAGTYTSLGGCAEVKIEDNIGGRKVWLTYHFMHWQFTFSNEELGRECYA